MSGSGKFTPSGAPAISGKYHSGRGVGKDRGLEAGNEREGAALGVFFRGAVLVADSQIEGQALGHAPFILQEAIVRLAADIGRGVSILEVLRRNAEDEVCQRVIGSSAAGEEIEFAVDVVVEDGIVPVSGNSGADLPIVPSVDVGERVGESKCRIHLVGGACFAESDLQAIVEIQVRRALRVVLVDPDVELRSRRQLHRRLILVISCFSARKAGTRSAHSARRYGCTPRSYSSYCSAWCWARPARVANWNGFNCGLRNPPMVALSLSLSVIEKSNFTVSSLLLSVCAP